MELAGSTYLFALAGIAMAFVSFSTIVLVIRRTLGASLTPFQWLLTRFFVECGFLAALFSFVPPLLVLFGLPHRQIWQISSALLVLSVTAYWIAFYRRRRAVTTEPPPLRIKVNAILSALVTIGLLLNVVGTVSAPGPGLYALAVTYVLLQAVQVFLLALDDFIKTPMPT